MKKLFVFAVLALGVAALAKGQNNGDTRFSVGAELGVPTGSFANGWGFGVGASAQAEHFFQENVSGTGMAGFISYIGKSVGGNLKNKSYNIIPLRVGARVYAGEGFHAGAQIGVGFLSIGGNSATAFAYSPQIGYNFKTNNGKAIDATLKYDGYTKNGTFGALGIRIAFVL